MIRLESLEEVSRFRNEAPGPVGFVPTMGALHAGHMALVERSVADNATTVASVFVNPSQFNSDDDFATYPRDLARDTDLLESAGSDAVFTPNPEHMYPDGFQTWVEVEAVSKPLEGAHRPGHFRGVCTVVLKLFNLVRPARAYFGQKDAQQLAVIRRMVADLHVPVEIVAVPTVRSADGLALSSRNVHLSATQREAALGLHRALVTGRELWDARQRDPDALREAMGQVLAAEDRVRVDYVSVADPTSLEELHASAPTALLSLAAFVGETRLIDNILVGGPDTELPDSLGQKSLGGIDV